MYKGNEHGILYTDESVKDLYFDEPTQVLFKEKDAPYEGYLGGIAYKDIIICGGCGAIVFYDDCTSVFVYEAWIDITEAIGSEEDIPEISTPEEN